MAKFRIKFKHTLEEFYTSIIEADSIEEAKEIFEDGNAFDYLESDEPSDVQGLRIDIIEVKQC